MTDTSTGFPIRLGSSAQFACIRDFFRRSYFNDTTLCRLLEMDDMSDLGRVVWEKFEFGNSSEKGVGSGGVAPPPLDLLPLEQDNTEPSKPRGTTPGDKPEAVGCSPALGWCMAVFLRGLRFDENRSRAICGEEVFSAMMEMALLNRSTKGSGTVFSPVWVYPADGFVLVSDRRDNPEADTYTPPPDVVFPAIYAGTLRFLRLLPNVNGDVLDLCGGSGIGALHLARNAVSAATADVTERSALYADFNVRLNGFAVASLCGDLYEPVLGKQFDLISAHPPFVPATGPSMIYRDGGDAGEDITRRVIEGLPQHLRPGGLCVLLCVARDTEEETFERRARSWLGAVAPNFDLVFGVEKFMTLEGVVDSMRRRSQEMTGAEAHQLLSRLRQLGTRQFAYGALFVQRFAQPVTDSPLRIRITAQANAADFERLLAWRVRRRHPDFNEWLAASRPRLAGALELTARHVVQDGSLVPAEFVFSISSGLENALRPDAWLVPLIARLQGNQSVREVFEQARHADDLPAGFALEDFSRLVEVMIERGLLEFVPETPLGK
jgi:SAM-dependent methyltransferase